MTRMALQEMQQLRMGLRMGISFFFPSPPPFKPKVVGSSPSTKGEAAVAGQVANSQQNGTGAHWPIGEQPIWSSFAGEKN